MRPENFFAILYVSLLTCVILFSFGPFSQSSFFEENAIFRLGEDDNLQSVYSIRSDVSFDLSKNLKTTSRPEKRFILLDSSDYFVGNVDTYDSENSVEETELESEIRTSGDEYLNVTNSESSKNSLINGDSFKISADVNCEILPKCKSVNATLRFEDGSKVSDSGGVYLYDGESNPARCGDLRPNETCEVSWKLNTSDTGNYSFKVTATDSRGEETSGKILDVSVKSSGEEYLKLKELSLLESTSQTLNFTFSYDSSMEFNSTCVVNSDSSQSCKYTGLSSGSGKKGCKIEDVSYGESNKVDCVLKNNSYGESSGTLNFGTKGSINSLNTDYELINVYTDDNIKVSCEIENQGDLILLGGKDNRGYTAVDMSLEGPESYLDSRKIISSQDLSPGSSLTVEERFKFPENTKEGNWTVKCSKFRLIDVLNLDQTVKEKKVELINDSEGRLLRLDMKKPDRPIEASVGDKKVFEIVLEDSEGNNIDGAKVYVDDNLLENKGNGVYSGEIYFGDKIKERESIAIEASKNGYLDAKKSIDVVISDSFGLQADINRENFSIGDSVRVDGKLKNMTYVLQNPEVLLKFEGPNGFERTVNGVFDENKFSGAFSLKAGHPSGSWTVNISVKSDKSSASTIKEFYVHPASPESFYLNYALPEERTFNRGSELPIEVEPVSSTTGERVKLNNVLCNFSGQIIELKESGAFYNTVFKVPEDLDEGNHILKCEGVRKVNGEKIRRTNSLMVVIERDELSLEIINPEDRELKVGQNLEFKVQVKGDESPVSNASVRLYVNGKRTSVDFEEDEKGVYRGDFAVKDEINSFSLEAEDKYGNVGKTEVIRTETVGGGWSWILFIEIFGAILLLGSILFFLYYRENEEEQDVVERSEVGNERARRLRNNLDDLKMKLRSIESSRKEAQKNYYKRKIDEKTFKQLMQKYEQKKTEVKNEIEEIKKELNRMG